MDIQPSDPPGRPNRKLRGHLEVVKRLHHQGYSIGGIQKAFCDAGVVIGWSTVQREVARLNRVPTRTISSAPKTEHVEPQQKAEHVTTPTPSITRIDVESFFKDQALRDPLITKALRSNG